MKSLLLVMATFTFLAQAQSKKQILINTDILDHMRINYDRTFDGITAISIDESLIDQVSHHAHEFHRCGGYELIDDEAPESAIQQLFVEIHHREVEKLMSFNNPVQFEFNPYIAEALTLLEKNNLQDTVDTLSQYRTRSSRSRNPNDHVLMMYDKVKDIIADSNLDISSQLIEHSRTKQKTLQVRIEGSSLADQIIVLGGHLDSTAFFSDAPGADDNASGSANLLEVFRVLSQQKQPLRSIEIFWYAAEEVGLVGSSEIAKEYKAKNIDVVGVMQLDMTAFAGSGVFTIGNITDFTSPWLQQVLVSLNNLYVNALIHEDECGYGCSDHAAWFRQGFDTVFPIESKFREANKSIHSGRDTIEKLNFEHSLVFAKLALSYALELANSEARNPN